jgi:3D (Asp-Asp-Asp) domain-containing protein
MKNSTQNIKNTFNYRLFMRCFKVETAIGEILSTRVNLLPSGRVMSYFVLILALLLAPIPGNVHIGSKTLKGARADLKAITPAVAHAAELEAVYVYEPLKTISVTELPYAPDKEAIWLRNVIITFYSSTVDQTDSTPFITADGTYVHDGIIAANCLPFGKKVKFPDYYGDKVFVVHDRMNSRYGCNKIDIWLESRAEAKQRGVVYTVMEVY